MKYVVTIGGLDMKETTFECYDAMGVALVICEYGYPKTEFNRLVCDIAEYVDDNYNYVVMFPNMYVSADIKMCK